MLTRDTIHECAARLTMHEPLGKLSTTVLARQLGVTPALVHYYAGTNDEIIAGVVERYFRVRVERLKPLTGDWRLDLEQHAQVNYEVMLEYGGVLRYLIGTDSARFPEFAQGGNGESSLRFLHLDRISQIMQRAGFSAHDAALGYYLLTHHIASSAFSKICGLSPDDSHMRNAVMAPSQQALEGARFSVTGFATLGAEDIFDAGLRFVLDGLASRMGDKAAAPTYAAVAVAESAAR